MSKFLKLATTAFIALSVWACVDNTNKPANGTNAGNSNANSNMTASKAPPSKDALFDMDKKANEAYIKGDSKYFEGFLSDKFVMYDMGKRYGKAETVKMIGETKCDVKSSSFDDPQMSTIDADTAVIVYKSTFDGTCSGSDGKAMKIPSPVRSASVYTRGGDKWMGLWHGEVPISDAKNPPKPPPAPAAKSDNKNAANSNSNTAANTSAAPSSEANTDALVAIEKSGWEAWKAHDAQKLNDLTTKDLSFVDLMGNYTATKADTVKGWTENKCDIKSVNISDGSSVSLSPTLNVLFFKGTADGMCDNMKVLPVHGTSFYVKEGDTWKLAFGFESPA